MLIHLKGWASGEGGTILHTTDGGGVVSVERSDNSSSMVEQYLLSQNFPNPFNPSTIITFQIPKTGLVTLKIYDVLGRQVTTLVNEELNVGKHETVFDASRISSGIYFYQLKAGSFVQTKKMILIK